MSEVSETVDITKDTRVQLALVLALFAGIIGALAWAQSMKSEQIDQSHAYEISQQAMRGEIREIKSSVDSLRKLVETSAAAASDTIWQNTHHYDWATRLQLLNPDIRVPDPQNGNRPYDLNRLSMPGPIR